MVRSRRTRILIEGDGAFRQQMAAEVRTQCSVSRIEAPAWALVMLTVRETARNSLFHPGEVLVSRAKVQVDGSIGYGLITGDRLQEAEDLALIDGAWNAGSAFIHEWTNRLEMEERIIEHRRTREQEALSQTKVDFQSMDTEVSR